MRSMLQLNEGWFFLKEHPENLRSVPIDAKSVCLPHTWNGIDGQDGGNDYFRGTCCYAKKIQRSELPAGQRYFLETNGANSSADVYLNGVHLAHHDGGYSAWRVDLTEALQNENLLVIMVDNAPNETVYPQHADFSFYGGLYRSVNIIAVPETHFELLQYGHPGIHVTPAIEGQNAKVHIDAPAVNLQPGDQIRYRIVDDEGDVVAEQIGCGVFWIENVHLWDGKKDPYLYTAEAAILRGDTELDTVTAQFGCRSFVFDPERGFILNGREYPLHGVCRHQDRWQIGNALLPEHHREDMDLIYELGANTIRLAHYQHDQYFYDLCDERGMIVWAEIPYISRHMSTGNENTVQQMQELIIQCYNHPSIVVWGLSNEITMVKSKDTDLLEHHKCLNELVHEMDKTRLTTMAYFAPCKITDPIVQIPDVVSYNLYFGWYSGHMEQYGPWFDKFHGKFPNIPIGCSEYGCEALNWHTSNPQRGDYTEEYQAKYHESVIRQLFTRPYIWATHVWNMFDFGADARMEGGENGQNHKGLVTIDRKYKKDAFYAYKAWLSEEPFVHICGKRYIDRAEDVSKVTVYSNLPEVELFANGKSLGKKTAEDHFFYFDVPLAGETALTAKAGVCTDESLIRKVSRPNPDYVLRQPGAVLNWCDVTAKEGYFCLNDRFWDLTKAPRGVLWLGKLLVQVVKNLCGPKKNTSSASGLFVFHKDITILQYFALLDQIKVHFDKEELLRINDQLNKIKKPRH